jgi:hypothetical protein
LFCSNQILAVGSDHLSFADQVPQLDPPKLMLADLTKAELIERLCAYFNCQYVEPLHQIIAQKVA